MICFVILHYMAIEQTVETVNKILELDGDKRVIIVDNASPNNSFKKLKHVYGDNKMIDLIHNDVNLGFAKGNNIGYKFAKIHYNPEFIVVMNSDILIKQNDFIARVKKSYYDHAFHIMGPDIITFKGGFHQNPMKEKDYSLGTLKKARRALIIKNHLKSVYWIKWRIINRHPQKRKQSVNTKKVTQIVKNKPLHGSFYVFSSDFINDNDSCFYPKTFMYMEAQILYYLAMKNNYTMIYDPTIEVVHIDDVSTDMTFSNRYKKAIFSNRALLQSTTVFIELLKG
ncbi:glycosyltransferase family 2 protein [Loigolactobacillus binensis]|uniref:Glycosyltransferase family 2 protein n=1 Tax=Loigolactobacillus binensis TaxID=2559922 RepID=A0ABW3EDG3_9LACO|nr:glycosyltransferase [Loigolactobacillus binensis]